MEITFDEAVEYLEEGCEIRLECEGFSYEVSPADDWVGGDGIDGYISLVLGNVAYGSAKHVLRESIKHLSQDNKEVKIFI